jgi:LmbE family N-acetylglucosaminyl deacetylase
VNKQSAYMLVISPHMTDTEFGVGGIVPRLVREGKRVIYVLCTDGDQGTSINNIKPHELVEIRKKEQLAAAKILGVTDVIFLGHTDLGLEYTDDFRKEILRLILEYRPEVVATCDPFQRYLANPDHRVTGQAVLDAVWPYAMAANTYPDLRKSEFDTHRVNEVWLWASPEPNFVVDISDTWETKMAAFQCHKSQIGDPIVPDFARRFNEMFKNAAKGQNFAMGEAFHRVQIPDVL